LKNWSWLSGGFLKSTDTKWKSGQPNNNGGNDYDPNEIYAFIRKQSSTEAKLYDSERTNTYQYICEYGNLKKKTKLKKEMNFYN
jgi:hypothetical protein